MFNHLIGTYEYKGTSITVRKSGTNGMYQLSAMVGDGVKEERRAKIYDTFDEEDTIKDFIEYIK